MIIADFTIVFSSKRKRWMLLLMGTKVQEVFRKRLSAKSQTEKKRGAEYLEKFLKAEGGQKTASGLAYKIIKTGQGTLPKKTDIVEVHYTGKLIDGTVFDSSRERDKPVSFPLNRVIKGWDGRTPAS